MSYIALLNNTHIFATVFKICVNERFVFVTRVHEVMIQRLMHPKSAPYSVIFIQRK